MHESLEQVLADERSDADVLDRRGHTREAATIMRICDRVAAAAEDYITFIPESEAKLRSARPTEWFRNRFAAWEREGLARWAPTGKKVRQYRRCIVPQRVNLDAVRRDAQRTAEDEARASA